MSEFYYHTAEAFANVTEQLHRQNSWEKLFQLGVYQVKASIENWMFSLKLADTILSGLSIKPVEKNRMKRLLWGFMNSCTVGETLC